MRRNITIAYFLSFTFHSWFWLGNWIFYYLSFGNYATVALLDSGAVMSSLLAEIPTGAFTDMVGKKKSLMLAFALQAVGNVLMGISGNFWMLAGSLWFFICVGGAFYSGTIEALVFDSLKVLKEEHLYERNIGTINATRLWSMAICGVIGGLAYSSFHGLPYILNGIVCLLGFVACFYLKEPKIDTDKYTITSFFSQNTLGIKALFKNAYMSKLSWFLIATGAMGVFIYNILDDLLLVEYGYTPFGVSLVFSIVCLVAGFASMYLPRWKTKIDQRMVLIVSMIVMAFLLMLSPVVGMIAGGVLLMFRVIMEVLGDNAASVMVNKNTDSKVRATTLSSLSLLRSIPYAVGGSFLGGVVLLAGGARNFSMWFGLVLLLVAVILGSRIDRKVTPS